MGTVATKQQHSTTSRVVVVVHKEKKTRKVKMKLVLISLLVLVGVSCTFAARRSLDEVENKDEPFDGVGIGLVSRPKYCEKKTKKGDLLRVTFNASTGHEGEGKSFDTTYEKEPLEFVLGDGQMIGGFEVGLSDMCVGEIRHLTVPEQYAYGANGIGALPSRVTMYFFVKLISFEAPKADKKPKNIFKAIDTNKDGLLATDEVKAYLVKEGVKDLPGDHGIKQMMRDIFKEEDRNFNGYIDHEEFSGTKRDEL